MEEKEFDIELEEQQEQAETGVQLFWPSVKLSKQT